MCKNIGHYRPRLEDIQIMAGKGTDMTGPAQRDLVWDAALRALVSNPASIRLNDVQVYIDAEVSDRTVRRTMGSMQTLGWFEKDKEGGHYWYPGPKAREFLRVPGGGRPGDRRQSLSAPPRHERKPEEKPEREPEREPEPEPAPVQTGGASPVEPERDPIEVAVGSVNVRAQGAAMDQRRRDQLTAILEYIRDEGEVTPAELRGKFYPDADVGGVEPDEAADTVGYGSERSWWKNFVYMALSEVNLVETGGEGSHTWFYVGPE